MARIRNGLIVLVKTNSVSSNLVAVIGAIL